MTWKFWYLLSRPLLTSPIRLRHIVTQPHLESMDQPAQAPVDLLVTTALG